MNPRNIVAVSVTLLLALSLVLAGFFPAQAEEVPTVTVNAEGDLELQITNAKGPLTVDFSLTDSFYSEDVNLSLTSSWDESEIYYTTDGTDPTRDSLRYEKEILLNVGSRTRCMVVKALAVSGDITGETAVRSYILDQDPSARFTTLIVSLSTDRYNLYDFDYGIFVPGRLRQEYIAQNGSNGLVPTDPANYNLRGMEGERPVYVECFTQDGVRVVAQNAGMRVHGGWSRDSDQKSIKLIARKSYEPEKGSFPYDFFPEHTADNLYNSPIIGYDTIVLRNGANDRNFGMIRNEVASQLAMDWGFVGVTPSRPAAVFLNGEYYGFAMLQLTLEDHYLEDILDAPVRSFDIVGNGEEWYDSDDYEAVEDLKALRSLADLDLTKDEHYQKVTQVLDVDNMLMYYAFEIFMGNDDWPNNNLKRWRYTGGVTGDSLHPWLDGRWRYLMYDLDWTLGLYSGEPDQPTFQNVLGGIKKVPLLTALLKRPELAEKFTNYLCDLMAFLTPERVQSAIDAVYNPAAGEIAVALNSWKYDNWVNEYTVLGNHWYMQAYAGARADYIKDSLEEYFGYGEQYYIQGGENIKIGTQSTGGGWYYKGLSVTLTPDLPRGKVFDHWLVNGERQEGESLVISDADAAYEVVRVQLVSADAPGTLGFVSASYAVSWNGCVIANNSGEAIGLQGFYVSDDPSNLKRWAFPDMSLAPGQSVTLTGKQYNDAAALMTIPLGFNAQAGEVLILSDEAGNAVDWIAVSWSE